MTSTNLQHEVNTKQLLLLLYFGSDLWTKLRDFCLERKTLDQHHQSNVSRILSSRSTTLFVDSSCRDVKDDWPETNGKLQVQWTTGTVRCWTFTAPKFYSSTIEVFDSLTLASFTHRVKFFKRLSSEGHVQMRILRQLEEFFIFTSSSSKTIF